MLSFSDFAKLYGAYEMYVQSQTAPTAAPAPVPTAAPAPAPTAAPAPVAPITPPLQNAMEANNAQQTDYQNLISRVSALENRPPQPSMETPKPATLDDIILGLVGGGENG